MHKNNLGIMDSCSWAEPTVEAEIEPVTAADSPIRAEGTFLLDTSVQEGTYHSPNHNCLRRGEGEFHARCASMFWRRLWDNDVYSAF